MWISKLLPTRPKASPSNATPQSREGLSIAEVSREREAAVRNMIAALRRSNFIEARVEAREHSYEEIRLKRLLETLRPDSRRL
jgi:hypothetical protein